MADGGRQGVDPDPVSEQAANTRQTELYENNSTMVGGKKTFNIFSTTSHAEHTRMKRPIAKYYSLGHVLAIEPHMDTVINDLIKHLDNRFAIPNRPCSLGEWIAFCKFPHTAPLNFEPSFTPNTGSRRLGPHRFGNLLPALRLHGRRARL